MDFLSDALGFSRPKWAVPSSLGVESTPGDSKSAATLMPPPPLPQQPSRPTALVVGSLREQLPDISPRTQAEVLTLIRKRIPTVKLEDVQWQRRAQHLADVHVENTLDKIRFSWLTQLVEDLASLVYVHAIQCDFQSAPPCLVLRVSSVPNTTTVTTPSAMAAVASSKVRRRELGAVGMGVSLRDNGFAKIPAGTPPTDILMLQNLTKVASTLHGPRTPYAASTEVYTTATSKHYTVQITGYDFIDYKDLRALIECDRFHVHDMEIDLPRKQVLVEVKGSLAPLESCWSLDSQE